MFICICMTVNSVNERQNSRDSPDLKSQTTTEQNLYRATDLQEAEIKATWNLARSNNLISSFMCCQLGPPHRDDTSNIFNIKT